MNKKEGMKVKRSVEGTPGSASKAPMRSMSGE
jgi:hypothetical protein